MLATSSALTLFGVVMVYSASAMLAQKNYGSQFYFLLPQGGWAFVGLVAMVVAMRIDYRHYKRSAVILLCARFHANATGRRLFLPRSTKPPVDKVSAACRYSRRKSPNWL